MGKQVSEWYCISYDPVGSQTMAHNGQGHPLGVVWTPVGVFLVVTMIDRPTGISGWAVRVITISSTYFVLTVCETLF